MYDQQLSDAYHDLDACEREITELKHILRNARTVIESLKLGRSPVGLSGLSRKRTLEEIDKAL